jgi:hypothetical protein
MGADGTLSFIAQAGNAVKKLRVTPAADITMERFVAIAAEQQFAGTEQPKDAAQANW